MSSENVILLSGCLDEVFYDGNGNEMYRYHLCPAEAKYGCQVTKGVWHKVDAIEPSVIYEAKDGKYGEGNSEKFSDYQA